MARPLNETLTAGKALIFRITHRSNVPWILKNGLHCSRSDIKDANFAAIGSAELIEKRSHREVPVPPRGTLDNYISFYFTPFSPMLLNIKTGHGGIRPQQNRDIVILVSSLPSLEEYGVNFVFTDRHAYLTAANFYGDRVHLDQVDFELLQTRDFSRDSEDPGKTERYQAEALAHRHVPFAALEGLACYTSEVKTAIDAEASKRGLELKTVVQPGWYF